MVLNETNNFCLESEDDEYNYEEKIPDPQKKAINYLEKHNILQIFQVTFSLFNAEHFFTIIQLNNSSRISWR